MVQSQRSRASTGHLGAPIPVDFFNLRCYFLKSIKKSTSFNIFLPATNHNLFSFPFWYKENVYLTEFKGTIRFQFVTHPVLQPSKLFLFNSALLLINPSGNISNKNKKNAISIILQIQQSCLGSGQRELSITLREPVSRQREMRRRAAGSRMNLNVSCEGGGMSLSTVGEHRTGPPCGMPDIAG